MYKDKLVTSIPQYLLNMAKSRGVEDGFGGVGGAIEEALKLYFSFYSVQD